MNVMRSPSVGGHREGWERRGERRKPFSQKEPNFSGGAGRGRVRQLAMLRSESGQPDHVRGSREFSCRANPLGTVAFQ
jgi:hypothetical protein